MSSMTWFRLLGLSLFVIAACFAVPARTADTPKDKSKDKPKSEFTNSIGMKFMLIPKGKFMMGSTVEEREAVREELKEKDQPGWLQAEGPRHEVTITKPFYLGIYEVTQGQWKAVMGKDSNPSYFSRDGDGNGRVKDFTQKELDDFPVENVSWNDVQQFLKKLNALAAEKKYRVKYVLPTEAQWEYCCRGGVSTSEPFNLDGKPSKSISSSQANFNPFGGDDMPDRVARRKGDYLQRTCTVGSYRPNLLGLYDMHGNVDEWCADWYADNTYTKKARRDPTGPTEGSSRVVRGGCWANSDRYCRAADRDGYAPKAQLNSVGFRVAAVPHDK
jgi:formylglycine-generating enzyme required for sulfatase activity